MPIEFPVFQVFQNGKELFVGTMSGAQLEQATINVDEWFYGPGYQRKPITDKVDKISKYLRSARGTMPTSLLASIRDSNVRFRLISGSYGNLVVPDGATIYMVDGQHRVKGLLDAIAVRARLRRFVFPTVFICPSRWHTTIQPDIEEGKSFITINKTQTGVKGDLIDSFAFKLGNSPALGSPRALDGVPEDIRKDMVYRVPAYVTTTVLNGHGAWHNLIRMANQPKGDTVIGQKAVTDSVVEIIRQRRYRNVLAGPLADRLDHYWRAILARYPDATSSPKEHWLQKRLGMVVYNRIFPRIDVLTPASKTIDNYAAVLRRRTKFKQKRFWSRQGKARTMGTSYSSVNDLAREIMP